MEILILNKLEVVQQVLVAVVVVLVDQVDQQVFLQELVAQELLFLDLLLLHVYQ